MNTSRDKAELPRPKHKGKTNSMNDSLLNRILKDKVKREQKTNHNQDSILSKTSNDKKPLNLSTSRVNSNEVKDCANTLETRANDILTERVCKIPKYTGKVTSNFKNNGDLFEKLKLDHLTIMRNEKNNKDLILNKNSQIILEQYMESQIKNTKLQSEIKVNALVLMPDNE
jgi:hypothetical protein